MHIPLPVRYVIRIQCVSCRAGIDLMVPPRICVDDFVSPSLWLISLALPVLFDTAKKWHAVQEVRRNHWPYYVSTDVSSRTHTRGMARGGGAAQWLGG